MRSGFASLLDRRVSAHREREPAHPNRINFAWLVRLRWSTIAGQLVTIAAVRFAMRLDIPLVPLLALVGLSVVVNVACVAAARLAEPEEWWLAAVMALDVLVFTGLLYFTGGPFNPFSFLYLVPIALGAITLRGAWTWALVALSLGCSAVLFATHHELSLGSDHASHMRLHLQGMWVAFGVAAAFIVYFLLRVRRALEAREAELAASQEMAARQERLASLATLAAGAAHELATPLSTIAVVAKDLERDVAAEGGAERAIDDARLVRRQVERCREILSRMRADAGDTAGESFVSVTVADVLRQAVGTGAGDAPLVRTDVSAALAGCRITIPQRALVQALRVLIENAQQASRPGGEVSVRVTREAERVRFEVHDRGAGMGPEVLARVGEPFYTTKPAGQGMGLGVFLARAVAERLGGGLVLQSAVGQGTVATFSLPLGGAPSVPG
jgi:two-component system sensor histidine kinase RegB